MNNFSNRRQRSQRRTVLRSLRFLLFGSAPSRVGCALSVAVARDFEKLDAVNAEPVTAPTIAHAATPVSATRLPTMVSRTPARPTVVAAPASHLPALCRMSPVGNTAMPEDAGV